MIAYVRGILAETREDSIVVEAGQIGFNIQVPGNVLGRLPSIGSEVKIYTYTHVREDAFLLYGFMTRDDLEIFKKCISVSGIGPKGGLALLSVMNADALRFAILSGDAKAIAKAPGIGARTAERLILELRDKVKPEAAFAAAGALTENLTEGSGNAQKQEAVEALVALGYSSAEALKAVNQIPHPEEMDSEAILRAALKNIF